MSSHNDSNLVIQNPNPSSIKINTGTNGFTNIHEYEVITSTTNSNIKNVFSFIAQKNTNYLITLTTSSKNINGAGGSSFVLTKRVGNNNNNITISAIMENQSNTDILNSNISITNTGNHININVIGANNININWTLSVRIISST